MSAETAGYVISDTAVIADQTCVPGGDPRMSSFKLMHMASDIVMVR